MPLLEGAVAPGCYAASDCSERIPGPRLGQGPTAGRQGTPEISSYGKTIVRQVCTVRPRSLYAWDIAFRRGQKLHRMRSVVRWPFGEVMKFFFRVLVLSFAGRLDTGSSILDRLHAQIVSIPAPTPIPVQLASRPDEDW